ncbi:hypothetical protein GCM10020001_023850 [Nonomuraea salmonea]
MPTVTRAGRASGSTSRHSMTQSPAPSIRIDSNSSLGMSRMKFARISTVIGIAKPMDGRISASRLSYRCRRVIM